MEAMQRECETLRARNKHLEATNSAVRHEQRSRGNMFPLKPGQSPREAELEERLDQLGRDNEMLAMEVDCIPMLNGQVNKLQQERDLIQGNLAQTKRELDRVMGM